MPRIDFRSIELYDICMSEPTFKDYLQIILNWPFLGFVLVFCLIQIYKTEIRSLINRIKKFGSTEFSSQSYLEETSKSIIESSAITPPGVQQNWEMMYYGKAIVLATAQSLLWLNNIGSSTEMNFRNNIVYHPGSIDIETERESQFSTLLNFKFIEYNSEKLIKVSNKGTEFLRFYNLIK